MTIKMMNWLNFNNDGIEEYSLLELKEMKSQTEGILKVWGEKPSDGRVTC